MTLEEQGRNAAIGRRAFLKRIPRQVFAGVRNLMRDGAPGGIAGFSRVASTSRRALALMDIPRCLAWGGSPCQTCYLRCPLRDEAMVLDDGRPLIMASACDGCGVCIEACRTVNDAGAIRLVVEPVSPRQEAGNNLNNTPSRPA